MPGVPSIRIEPAALRMQSCDGAQQRRLPDAVRSEQGEKLARRDDGLDVRQQRATADAQRDAAECDHRFAACAPGVAAGRK